MKKIFLIITVVAATGFITAYSFRGYGHGTLFPSKQFHYQALRTMGHSFYRGAAPGEVMHVISEVEDEDEESWRKGWLAMADRCEQMAESAIDNISRGNALLRASNYLRTAEYFIDRDRPDEQRLYERSTFLFRQALESLGFRFSMYYAKWENGRMRNYFFQGNADKPLIMICGGYDSTNEESFFWGGRAFIKRGYNVLLFEGPGQSDMIRKYNIRFTEEWGRVVAANLNEALKRYPVLAGRKKLLIGISLGGLLAGRAAASEDRLDGVILFGAPFDLQKGALFQMPGAGRFLYENGYVLAFNLIAGIKARFDLNVRWGLRNGIWTIGGDTPYGFLEKCSAYTLEDLHEKVNCHVMVLYGEKDIYVSDGYQDRKFKTAFPNSKSYCLKVFRGESGAAEHCQCGSVEQSVFEMINWIEKNISVN